MQEGINVFLRYDETFVGVNLWVIHQKGNERRIFKPTELEIKLLAEWEDPEPTMRFRGTEATQFLQQLSDGLSQAGFKPKVEQEMKGEITAVRYHLEDMRKLVFNK